MKKFLALLFALSCFPRPSQAHRLDEYLQAAIFSIAPEKISGTMRLIPGVAVAPAVIEAMHHTGGGDLSAAEQKAYAEHVLDDLRLEVDGRPLRLSLLSYSFPSTQAMREGTGEIDLAFSAEAQITTGTHELLFDNEHEKRLSVYLVNTLVPEDRTLHIDAQSRNQNQSQYRVTFERTSAEVARKPERGWSGFGSAFHLGARHIADGTDHLLFLLTLLLPAPLRARNGEWAQREGLRRSVFRVLTIVTAFTVGHSLTLAMASLGVLQLPSRPVEVLIAVSILISAIHALRPIFPGHEAFIAAFFGLIHGLAFASALSEVGVSGWYRLVSLAGFNLGIEAMQLAVVLATLPSLLLWSRARSYSVLRIGGASLSALAALSWIVERLTGQLSLVTALIERVAQRGPLLLALLFLLSVSFWVGNRLRNKHALSWAGRMR